MCRLDRRNLIHSRRGGFCREGYLERYRPVDSVPSSEFHFGVLVFLIRFLTTFLVCRRSPSSLLSFPLSNFVIIPPLSIFRIIDSKHHFISSPLLTWLGSNVLRSYPDKVSFISYFFNPNLFTSHTYLHTKTRRSSDSISWQSGLSLNVDSESLLKTHLYTLSCQMFTINFGVLLTYFNFFFPLFSIPLYSFPSFCFGNLSCEFFNPSLNILSRFVSFRWTPVSSCHIRVSAVLSFCHKSFSYELAQFSISHNIVSVVLKVSLYFVGNLRSKRAIPLVEYVGEVRSQGRRKLTPFLRQREGSRLYESEQD